MIFPILVCVYFFTKFHANFMQISRQISRKFSHKFPRDLPNHLSRVRKSRNHSEIPKANLPPIARPRVTVGSDGPCHAIGTALASTMQDHIVPICTFIFFTHFSLCGAAAVRLVQQMRPQQHGRRGFEHRALGAQTRCADYVLKPSRRFNFCRRIPG